MCRHVCPIGNADGQERNNARARALMIQYVLRGTEKLEEIADNMYECTLCGACTNNCKTGWDPKIFIQEVKAQIILEGKAPDYIQKLLEKYGKNGTIFSGKPDALYNKYNEGKVLFLAGQNAIYKDAKSVEKALNLLQKGGVDARLEKQADDTGLTLFFLAGKLNETVETAKACAEALNKYKKVVVYNPMDLSLILHEWKEWGIEVKAELVSFNEQLLRLFRNGKLKAKKSNKEYSLQDHFAYARELDDEKSGRELIKKVGVAKEMLLIGKEANLAGHLVMNEYMPEKMALVAEKRWVNAINMGCRVLVTENPDEHVLLAKTAPKGYKVITIEEMILENL
jgi:Fe-S oxidoreductase